MRRGKLLGAFGSDFDRTWLVGKGVGGRGCPARIGARLNSKCLCLRREGRSGGSSRPERLTEREQGQTLRYFKSDCVPVGGMRRQPHFERN